MKTDRMTLLIAPADKAAIAARAASLHMSVSELVRQATVDYDPEERATLRKLTALIPELHAAAADMRTDLATAHAAVEQTRQHFAGRETYAQHLQRQIEADSSIDWPAMQRIFGLTAPAELPAA